MKEKIEKEYQRWLESAQEDADLISELRELQGEAREDAFYRDLAFGTGGLRGVIGAGTNRMNIYTVGKASQGLADYLKKEEREATVVIGYDSRIKSRLFAERAAAVFAANGICVHIWAQLMPVPTVSFAVRRLKASAGVMITASHNPSKYNGYKVYGSDGCQITTEAAGLVLSEIEKLDAFADVRCEGFERGLEDGMIQYIEEEVYTAFVEAVKSESVLFGDECDKNVSIVYTPLNGAGLKPVLRTLRESGFESIRVVSEQEEPDGNFPTCPYPNPEIKEALALGIEYARRYGAELLLATDPDCDRVGIAVRDGDDYKLLTGNEVGMLLLDYICSQRTKHGKMPKQPVLVKTVVTIDMAARIAAKYGVETRDVLTGFKFIGEQIGLLEGEGREDSYIFGFEESYGYLSGSYVRDKDGVNAAFLVAEMFSYYKKRGISLIEKLSQLYLEFGYSLNTLHSFSFEGREGFLKMQEIMRLLREGELKIASLKAIETLDFSLGIGGLPRSDVLKFLLEGNSSVVVRPSGTEPKMKVYISVSGESQDACLRLEADIINSLSAYFK